MTRQRKTTLADEKGCVNLGNHYAGKYFDLMHNEDGTITLTPVTVLKAGELFSKIEELPDQVQAVVEKSRTENTDAGRPRRK